MNDATKHHSEYMQVTFDFARASVLVAPVLAVCGAVLAGITAGLTAAVFVGFAILTAWALVVTIALVWSTRKAHGMLVDGLATMLDRIDAETNAIAKAAIVQTNINAGSGQMKVSNKPITYRVNGQVVTAGTVNQLNQIATETRKIEIPGADVRWMLEQIAGGYGHSKAKWVGKVELPYSRMSVDWLIYKTVLDALAEGGAIIGRGERASGKLIETDPAQLVKVIEAKHPGAGSRGIVLELPAETTGN